MKPRTKKYLKRAVLSFLFLSVCFIVFILNETKDSINADFSNIDSILTKLQKDDRNAGFSVSVFSKDSILFKSAYGFEDLENKTPYTTQTRQYIASISKSTIGIALLKAQELELLDINDPINKHLPFQISNPNFPNDEITIKQLATHTTSLDYNEPVVESLYISENLKQKSLKVFIENYFKNKTYGTVTFKNQKPGTEFNYSNIGAGLAAYIIELNSGLTYDEFTSKYIFEPLELDHTSWFINTIDSVGYSKYYTSNETRVLESPAKGVILYPARDLVTNINDLTTYCQAVMGKSSKLLTNASFDSLLSPQLESDVINHDVDNSGLFWMIDRNQYGITYQLTGMNGGDSNINTMMQFDPKTGLGYIFIGNTGQSQQNRINHIMVYNALVSLGDHYLMNSSKHSFTEKVSYKWHNIYSRFNALF